MLSTKTTTWLLAFLGLFVTALFIYQYTSIARHEDFYVAHHFGHLTDRLRILAYFFSGFMIALGIVVSHTKALPTRRFWIILLIFSTCLVSIAFLTRPTRSQDAYWSLLLGKGFTEYNLDPYSTQPLELEEDSWAYPVLAWKDISMIYGPVWTLLMIGIAKLTSSLGIAIFLLKIVMLLLLLKCGILLWQIMSLLNISPQKKQAIFFLMAWNPFIWQIALVDAHNDLFLLTSLLASLYFVLKKKYTTSIVALVLGGLVKYISIIFILIPLYYLYKDTNLSNTKKIQKLIIAGLISLALIFILYLPFGGFSMHSFVGLSAQIERIGLPTVFLPGTTVLLKIFEFSFSQLRWLGMITAIMLMALCLKKNKLLLAYTLPLILIFFFATPWFQSWYGLWLLPLASLYWPIWIVVLVSIFLIFTPELISPATMSLYLTAYATFVFGIKKIYENLFGLRDQ